MVELNPMWEMYLLKTFGVLMLILLQAMGLLNPSKIAVYLQGLKGPCILLSLYVSLRNKNNFFETLMSCK